EVGVDSGVLIPLAALVFAASVQDTSRYWQQSVAYSLGAYLDEASRVLTAGGRMVYRNNSPDTLREIYFHLYLNAFRPGSLWSADEVREGIHRFADLPDPYHAYE